MPETGTVVPLPPSERRLKEAETLATPQNFVPGTSVAAGQWASSGPARRMVPVGVAGELGSSYTVFEKNWTCPECHTENYASKARCLRCRARKPAGGGGLIRGGAAPAADEAADDAAADPNAAAHGEWKEVFDPDSKQLYYANGATGETRWDRPLEMGPTPHASGWFGRGAAGSKAADGYEANNAAYLKRPARKQVDYIASKNTVLEGAYEYNIWWGKYLGEHWGNGKDREPAETRCVLATDAGRTKADAARQKASGSFCLFFARGGCGHGSNCRYFHRLPVREDLDRFAKDEMRDVFGRERHKDFRDDMTGVGALMKPCRTLYVGSLLKSEYADPKALEEALWRNFGEWGEVENINLISRLSIAFVRYRYRSHAEFAFMAMANNHLDREENLNIRWAHDDPNPVAHDAAARADADALVEMLKAKGVAVEGSAALEGAPADYVAPSPKRLKAGGAGDYPDTDVQYAAADAAATWTQVPYPEDASRTYWWNEATGETRTDAPEAVADANCDVMEASLDAADRAAAAAAASVIPPGWAEAACPTSGRAYFYHAETGQTSWSRPEA
mmetsp:Transcript_1180/g.3517  ORF Transcript_1180/g.3517 Transcript_1180/m.3517 type:complete len:563 (-) Transcript_1180:23-1711(-)